MATKKGTEGQPRETIKLAVMIDGKPVETEQAALVIWPSGTVTILVNAGGHAIFLRGVLK